MTPVIIASKNRPELLKQTVESALRDPGVSIQLIIVDDASEDPKTIEYLQSLPEGQNSHLIKTVFMPDSKGCGASKNAGAAVATPSEYIYFSDNDVYFHDNWLKTMVETMNNHHEVAVLGGDRHPHHGVEGTSDGVTYSDQQVGFSMLMRKWQFNQIGPFVHGAVGLYGVEDTAMCTKAMLAGWKVAACSSRVLTHCGLTNSTGGQCAGYPEFAAQTDVPEGVIKI